MLHHIFTPNPKAITGKLQHPKRHFRKVMREAREFDAEEYTQPGDWASLWHYHADWSGNGNRGWRYRSRYFAALCIVYKKLAANIHRIGCPCQLFIYLNGLDAGHDAVYLHTPNPSDNYPTQLDVVRWGIPEVEEVLQEYLPGYRLRAGETSDGGVFIYSPGIGESMER